MLKDIQYSIIKVLEDSALFTACVWLYNGVNVTGNTLPFSTVEHRLNTVHTLDKMATEQASEFSFQVGVFANTDSEVDTLGEQAKKILAGVHTLYTYDSNTATFVANGSIRCEVTALAPMPVDNVEGISSYHRCYIDLTVFETYKL